MRPLWLCALGVATLGVAGTMLFPARPSRAAEPKPKGPLTFTKDIAPIMFQNCASCHRPGEIGPFPLLTYQDAKKRAFQIAQVTQKRLMPPWKAEAGFGSFHGERRLTEDQMSLIKQWVSDGAKQGDPKDLPALPKFPEGWSSGTPDAIFEPKETYTLNAEGNDVYQCFVLPTNYAEDRYLSGIEVHPSNAKVVHHVIAYLDTSGQARKLDAATPEPGYASSGGGIGVLPSGAIGGWAPGNLPHHLPDGVGILLPKGADIVMQVHYHKSGKTEMDRTKLGLYFTKKPVDKRARSLPVIYPFLQIKPGDANYTVSAGQQVSHNVTIWEVTPHMHLLGKEIAVHAALPDGTEKPLVKIPDWDFNWQTTYILKEPLKLPAGSKVRMTARYDNSEQNPRNPSVPPRLVTWGEQTTDEMCITFVTYTVDEEKLTEGKAIHTGLFEFGNQAQRGDRMRGRLRQLLSQRGETKTSPPTAKDNPSKEKTP